MAPQLFIFEGNFRATTIDAIAKYEGIQLEVRPRCFVLSKITRYLKTNYSVSRPIPTQMLSLRGIRSLISTIRSGRSFTKGVQNPHIIIILFQVPTLKDGDFVLFETLAIISYSMFLASLSTVKCMNQF